MCGPLAQQAFGNKHLLAFLQAPQEQLEHLLRICLPQENQELTHETLSCTL